MSFLIVGTPRSGTTLVQRLACELPGIRMSPETHFFCSFGQEAANLRFPLGTADLERALRAYATAFARHTGHPLALDVNGVMVSFAQSCGSAFELFSAIVRSFTGPADVLGEKSPEHLLWWRQLSDAVPELRLVFVVRDPRAVVASTLEMPWNIDTPVTIAERWRLEQAETRIAARTLGASRALLLRYEEVVANPSAASEALAGFLGFQGRAGTAGAVLDGLVLPWEIWKARALAPITLERVEAWRNELTAAQARDVTAICRAGMKRLGYATDDSFAWLPGRRFRPTPDQQQELRRFRGPWERGFRRIASTKL